MKLAACVALLICAAVGVPWVAVRALSSAEEPARAAAPESVARTQAKSAGLPPLTVDRNAPLLLKDAEPQKTAKTEGPVADNQACYVCHTNYQEEEMVKVHAENNVGCVNCHGQSLDHRNDENNTTPPEKMFGSDAIEANCATCHDSHDAPAKKVLARWKERCAVRQTLEEILCTDCHGDHRLKQRTVRWNKKTGELVSGNDNSTKPAAASR
jgi:hypothetical protein